MDAAAQGWIQFGLLMVTLISLALHAERRFTKMETRIEILWQVYLDAMKIKGALPKEER